MINQQVELAMKPFWYLYRISTPILRYFRYVLNANATLCLFWWYCLILI